MVMKSRAREDALVVEVRIGCAHDAVELGQPMQHQPLELGHLARPRRVLAREMRERAQHPADGVAQLAIGIDRGLQDLRADAQVVGIVGRATQRRRMSAPDCLITSCGAMTLPSDFDILRPSSSRTKPCVSTTS